MNDIVVKLVESPKAAESPAGAGANEVDPLAVDIGIESRDSPVDAAPDSGDNVENESSTGQNEGSNQRIELQPEVKDTPAAVEEPKVTAEPIKSDSETPEDKPPTPTNVETVNEFVETIETIPESEVKGTIEEDPLTSDLKSPNPKPDTAAETVESTFEAVKSPPKREESEAKVEESLQDIAKTAPENLKSALETAKSVPDTKKPEPVLEIKKSPEAIDSKKQETIDSPSKTNIALSALKIDAPIPAIKTPNLEPAVKNSTSEIVALLSTEAISNLQAQKTGPKEKLTDIEMAELPSPKSVPSAPASAVEEKKIVEKEIREKKIEGISVRNFEKERPYSVNLLTNINGDIAKEDQATKRRASEEAETESPLKKLCQEVEKTFGHHDSMVNDYIQTTTKNNIDEIQRHTEQLLAEIQTLRELAQKKEYEWNNILHLKKVKEEILLRLLRRKQVLLFEKSSDVNGSDRITDPFDYLNQAKNLAIDKSDEISGLSIKQPGSNTSPMMQGPIMPVSNLQSHFNPMSGLPPPYDKAAQPHMSMPKPVFQPMMLPGMPGFPRDMNGQLPGNFNMPMGRQGPTKDVKSIIADYRQRNPDVTPRRGRRMKSILNPNLMNAQRAIAPKVDGMNNMANLNNLTNLNMLFSNLDMNQKAMLERLQQLQAGGLQNSIFKDALVQFANMQQASSGLIPPPNRPETVTARPEHHMKERRRERPAAERVSAHESPPPPPPPSMGGPPPPPARPGPRVPPPPYPEISLLPVAPAPAPATPQPPPHDAHAQNSLLHGILTKPAAGGAGSAGSSPTLARLLTSPERRANALNYGQAKNCGEITITPVQPTAPEPQPEKAEDVVQLDDEESAHSEGEAVSSPAGSAGRLVIDEGGADSDTPLCQGCRRRDAQFVCAGCANQWYCSRDCQVAAWDDHSEMCSG